MERARLRHRLLSGFEADDRLFRSVIEVSVLDGVIRLFGWVRRPEDRAAAEAIARSVAGEGTRIRNEIAVITPGNGGARPVVADGRLRRRVAAALARDVLVRRNGAIEVIADAGEVTLRGRVGRVEDALAAVEAARRVAGVRVVRNEIQVGRALSDRAGA